MVSESRYAFWVASINLMAARRGGGKRGNRTKDEKSRGEELHALRRQVERLALLIERLEARRKHGGSRSGCPYHETKTEI